MNFLYPGFLFCLLAAAIPVLIHLFNFRKYKKVYFSNVAFIKAAQERNSSHDKLRNILILICRMLAVVFLVLGFARPYLSSGAEAGIQGEKTIDIYIDNSHSMAGLNKEGALLDEAKRMAKTIAANYTPNDKFRLTTNDFEGRHQRAYGYEEFSNLLDDIKISGVQRTLQQVVNRQQGTSQAKGTREGFIISDFQRHFVGDKAITQADGANTILVPLKVNALPNVAVDSIWSLSPAHRPGDEEKLVYRLRNYTDQPAKDIPVKLSINNQQKALARMDIPARKAVLDTLTFSGLGSGWQKGVLDIKDYPFTFDDQLKFSFHVNNGLDILHISGDPAERHITALFSGDTYFKLTTMPETNVQYNAIADFKCVILSGLRSTSSGLTQQLKAYVEGGGTVVVFPDLSANLSGLSSLLTGLTLPAATSVSTDSLQVSSIDLKSNLFSDVFEEVPSKMDLPRVKRHLVLRPASKSNREDIMQLPSGDPFFSRFQVGAGQVYLSSTSLNADDSNLSQHPVFVPLMYKIAFTSVRDNPLYYTLGESSLISNMQVSLQPNETLRLRSDSLEIIPELRQVPGRTLLYIADQVRASDFFSLTKADSLLAVYAFNDSRDESDLRYMDRSEMQQVFSKAKTAVADAGGDISGASLQNNHTELWKVCIVLCAVFLAIEALLIRFFNKKTIIKT